MGMVRRLAPLLLLLATLAAFGGAKATPCEVTDAWAHELGVRLGPDTNETFVGTPQVLRIAANDYLMFYASGNTVSGVSEWSTIRYARSVDGVTWTPGPVILRASDFGVQNLLDPYVILGFDGKLSLYVEGWDAPSLPPGPRAIYLARAQMITSWTPIGVALPAGAQDDWPRSPEVVRLPLGDVNGSYRMYYTAFNLTARARQLFTAVSADGRQWTKQGMVLGPGPLDPQGPSRFTLHPERRGLRLYYTEDIRYDRLLTAVSTDGLNWTREGPVLAPGPQWDRDLYVNSPAIQDFSGGVRLYYMGAGSVQSTPQIFSAWVALRNSSPTAMLLAPPTVPVLSPVNVDASASQDVDGDGLTYSWSMAVRPNGSVAALASTPKKSYFFADMPGAYVVRLQLADGCGGSAVAFASVTAMNGAPEVTVQVLPSPAVPVGGNVTLDASSSRDPEGYPLLFRWSLVSRPNASLAAINESSPIGRFQPDREGAYLVEVQATDIFGENTTHRIALLGTDSPPQANGGPDRSVAVGTEVRLDASASKDPGGDALLLAWSVAARPAGSAAALKTEGANASFVPDWPGTYVLQVTATDPAGLLDADVVLLEAWNSSPWIVACCSGTWDAGSLVQFDAEATDAETSGPLEYAWRVLVSPVGSRTSFSDAASNVTSLTLDVAGVFIVSITATDPFGAQAEASLLLHSNRAPVPLVSILPGGRLSAGTWVTFDGRQSYDPEADPVAFAWSVEDWPGRTDGVPLPSLEVLAPGLGRLMASTPGRYVVHLAVNDSHGASASREIVFDATNEAPEVEVFCPETVPVATPFHCSVIASDPDPGSLPACRWAIVTEPPTAMVPLNGTELTARVDHPGSYGLEVSCLDVFGAELSDAASLVAPSSPPVAAGGRSRTVAAGARVGLEASASDPDGGELTYTWSIEAGPANHDARLDKGGSGANFTATIPGLYTILVLVEDPEGNLDAERFSILVERLEPIPWELPLIAGLAVAVAILAVRRRPRASVQKALLLASGGRIVGAVGNGGDDSKYLAAVRSHMEKHDIGREGTRFTHRGRTVLVARGEHLLLAVWVQGSDAERHLPAVTRTLRDIEEALAEVLKDWGGDVSELGGTERYLSRLVARR